MRSGLGQTDLWACLWGVVLIIKRFKKAKSMADSPRQVVLRCVRKLLEREPKG